MESTSTLSRILAFAQEERGDLVMAMIVRIEGHAYRGLGAKMLIARDGAWQGGVSGGCLEGAALRVARSVFHDAQSRIVRFDTSSEGGHAFGAKLGCQGIIHVLFTPFGDREQGLYQSILSVRSEANVAWDISTESIESEEVSIVKADCCKHHTESNPQGDFCFVDAIKLSPRVCIFGAGDDVLPLVKMCQLLHWETEVLTDCVAQSAPKRFDCTVAPKVYVPAELDLHPTDYVVVMTHNEEVDKQVLKSIISQDAAYIGVLGPLSRTKRILESLDAIDALARLNAPIGLDLGAESPEEVALAIVAEIQAVYTGAKGNALKGKQSFIHERVGRACIDN